VTAERSASPWNEPDYVRTWTSADGLSELLRLPVQMMTALVAESGTPRLVVDIGSGPGMVLAALLERFPDARGVWLDASAAMHDQASERLARFGARVRFIVASMEELPDVGLPVGEVDVLTNARVAHHFDVTALRRFYRDAARLLAPGGWLATLDHIRPTPGWNRRLRAVLPAFAGPNAGKPTHPHLVPFPTVAEHLEALAAAGLEEPELVWRAFYSCLFMARCAGAEDGGQAQRANP
jgi:ubiquinone/menaquinone biosynthesis C-methylase UbiE